MTLHIIMSRPVFARRALGHLPPDLGAISHLVCVFCTLVSVEVLLLCRPVVSADVTLVGLRVLFFVLPVAWMKEQTKK